MKKRAFSKITRKEIKLPVRVALLFLLSFLITGFAIYLQPTPLADNIAWFFEQPLLILMNYLPVLLFTALFWFLFNNLFASAALVNIILSILSYINRLKIFIRDDPFVPRDIGLIREATDAMGKTAVKPEPVPIILIIATSAALIFLAVKFKTGVERRIYRRLVYFALTVALTALLIFFFFTSDAIYSSFRMPTIDEEYNASAVCGRYGFPYYFIRNLNVDPLERPAGYSDAEAEKILSSAKPQNSTEAKEISVHFVMAEAFSDIFEDKTLFDFAEGGDPMTNFHALEKEENTISGDIVAQGFGGGTANTEFDVQTGISAEFIGRNTSNAFSVIRKSGFANLSDLFSGELYNKSFLHPGDGWFYNRKNVYDYFGFDTLVFNNEFTDADKKGGDKWVSDEAFERKYFDLLQNDAEQGKRSFFYGVTTQNHMAYGTYKYPDLTLEPLTIKKEVSQHTWDVMSAYRMGIADSDKMLGEIVDRLRKSEEPVILVFFGDHKPYLGWGADSYLAYDELGYDYIHGSRPEDILKTHTVPYLIWENDAARKVADISKIKPSLDLPKDNLISAFYLGSLIYEITGRSGESRYFDFVCEARRTSPVIKNGVYADTDGKLDSEPTAEQAEAERRLRIAAYYTATR